MSEEADRQVTVPQGTFTLERYPLQRNQPLRAWDAADEFILSHLTAEGQSPSSVLVLNDAFGALTTALAGADPDRLPAQADVEPDDTAQAAVEPDGGAQNQATARVATPARVQMISDSFLAHAATQANLAANGRDASKVTLLDSLASPQVPFDAVLFKVPKSLSLLEDQLHRLRPHLTADTLILGGGMSKQIHTSTLQVCERVIGPTTTSRAQRKARLIHITFDPAAKVGDSPYPSSYQLEDTGFQLSNHASLFSRDHQDPGTKLLIEHLPRSPQAECIVDMGCGNGILGIVAARQHRDATLVFADESAMAIASAKENVPAVLGEHREAVFNWSDCLRGVAPGCADLVLCNPPFHQQQVIGDATAWQMFTEARQVLKRGGSLWVVGNRHLAYHAKLRRLFGNGEIIASNSKFVILKATRRQD